MPDILSVHAAANPQKLAVIDDRPGQPVRSLTYAEMEDQANRLANVLIELGAEPGTKVVWCGQNSASVVVLTHAARKVAATAVPLNYRLSPDEAAYVIDNSDARFVYVDAEYAPLLAQIRHQIPRVAEVIV